MKGQALTNEQKRAVIEEIYTAWCMVPYMRLGQLIENAVYHPDGSTDTFYVEDERLAFDVSTFAAKLTK
jgi:hypothetical protein